MPLLALGAAMSLVSMCICVPRGFVYSYRLSPEHTFPTPVDDCELATLYFMKHAATLGVDASRICLAGIHSNCGSHKFNL